MGEGRKAHRRGVYEKKEVSKLVVKKQNFQTRSGLLWLPGLSFLLEVQGSIIAYNPKALKSENRKWGGVSKMAQHIKVLAAKPDDLSLIL